MSKGLGAALLCGASIIIMAATPALAKQYDIPRGDLKAALDVYARQHNVDLIYRTGDVVGVSTGGVHGDLSADEALARLLKGTGLQSRRDQSGAIAIQRKPVSRAGDMVPVSAPAVYQAPDQPSMIASEPAGLEEIIVTAQRRAQNLQDVPVTVTALTSASLESSGISDTTDLQLAVPGLVTQQIANAFLPYIRGVGSNQTGNGIESSVAVYLDGVYQGVKSGNILELANIERIEVLKGPQGTLFGRNATGGAINIVTLDPSHDPTINAEVSYGRFDEKRARVYAAGAITDTLSASVAVSGRWNDGYIRDIFHDKLANPAKSISTMGKLLWKPTDNLTAKFSASYTYINDPTFATMHVTPGTRATAEGVGGLVAHGQLETALSRPDNVQRAAAIRLALDVRYDLGMFDLVSITGYAKGTAYNFRENDSSVLNLQHLATGQPSKQFGQELQLQSNGSDPLSWIVGLNYYWLKEGFGTAPNDSVLQVNLPERIKPADLLLPGSLARGTNALITTESKSAFAQATYRIGDKTRVTAGLRYSRDRKSANGVQYRYTAVPGNGTAGVPLSNGYLIGDGLVFGTTQLASMDLEKNWGRLTWRFALDHDITDSVMAYASYSRGFKSGGYVPGNVSNTQKPVDPEVLDAYEIGFKSDFFDRRLRINLAAYYYDYQDIQVALVTVGGTSAVQNAASARLYGIDLDFTALPVDRVTVRGGLNVLKSSYRDYSNAQLLLPNIVGQPCPAVPQAITIGQAKDLATRPQSGGNCTYSLNASGLDTIIAPKITGNLAIDYKLPLASGAKLLFTSSIYYNDGFDTAAGGLFTHIDSYKSISASVTWVAPDERYFMRVWGENLSNDVHPDSILPTAQAFQEISNRPISYGVTLGLKFGSR